MPGDRALAILVAACFALSCGSDSAGPSGKVTATVNDPSGDQFGTDSVQPDLVKLTVTSDSTGIDVTLDLVANAVSLLTDTIHGVGGYIDIDTDQDSLTGVQTLTDFYRPTGSTGMGEEYVVDFVIPAADSTVFVYDTAGFQTGSIRPVFSGKRVTFRIPLSMLGNDDGFVNVAVIVGNFFEPTDLTPNNGHLKVGGTPVAPYNPSTVLRSLRAKRTEGQWRATPRR